MMTTDAREQMQASLDALYKEVEKNPRRGGFGWFTMPDGTIVRYFQCHCDPDDPMMYMDQAIYDLEEALRHSEPLFDPNQIDSRRVRRELKDKMVNLGMRVNRVPSRVRRF